MRLVATTLAKTINTTTSDPMANIMTTTTALLLQLQSTLQLVDLVILNYLYQGVLLVLGPIMRSNR